MPRRHDDDPFLDVPDDPPLEDPGGAPVPRPASPPTTDAIDPHAVPRPPGPPEAPDTVDEDDPFDAVPDDDPTDLERPDRPDPVPAEPVDDTFDSDPFSDEVPADEPMENRPSLPWRTEAMVVALGQTLPAVLDPTAATSTWVGGPTDADGATQVLWLGPLTLKGPLAVTPGDEAHLRLGRDLLAGRVRIEV